MTQMSSQVLREEEGERRHMTASGALGYLVAKLGVPPKPATDAVSFLLPGRDLKS